jgi:predicted amidohydrolase
MRVAVSQFTTTDSHKENLANCISMINEAAVCKPAVIVLPEFCNTVFCHTLLADNKPCYLNQSQAWEEALSIKGPFLTAIAEQAKRHSTYIVLNVTIRRDLDRIAINDQQDNSVKSNISVTSCLLSPLGELIYQEDKQNLTKYEEKYFTCGNKTAEVVTTPVANIGLLMGVDTMTFTPSRSLALQGAQLLCNSINTFTLDQSHLHNPARACENNVFLASANKIGQSQIVSPDGIILASIEHNKTGFAFADVNLDAAGIDKKYRPDGTQLVKQLRPELYQKLTKTIPNIIPNNSQTLGQVNHHKVPATANTAIFATYKVDEEAIEDVCFYIENNLSDIIQLPELFFIADKNIISNNNDNTQQLSQIERLSKQVIEQVSTVLRPFQYVCTSLVLDGMHQAVLISKNGLFATQQQLHFCQRYQWTTLGEELKIIALPLEQGNVNITMLTGDDANIPEIVNIAALNGIHVLLTPFDIQESCEVEYNLLSRAAENRICIVAASKEKSFANNSSSNNDNEAKNNNQKKKIKSLKVIGFIANLTKEPTLLSQCKTPKFTGYLNQPLVKYQQGKITKAVIFPIAACNK